MTPLPIDEHLRAIVATLSEHGALVIVAPPGAGKTTRVPPALAEDGPVVLLQPRRVAARALAGRIAAERGWTVGHEVGWQVRFERRCRRDTRLLVATEGVLTRKLQADPLLSGWRTVVLDEFHERSLHADLALAFLRQARRARADLRLVVMSATLDPGPVARFLGGCPVIEVPGRIHPLEIEHAPGLEAPPAALRALGRSAGHVLCFLPGAPEIERAARALRPRLPADVRLLPLHGTLDAEAQDAALAPCPGRKLILATNIAETSLTVDGVTDVVDSGLQKVLRRDPSTGLDRLEVERVAQDSADQRAGRAGRTGPGRVLRLWDPRDRLRVRREPEIERVDLARPFLEVLAWGEDPATFAWFESPAAEPARAATELLEQLGATARGRITDLGRALCRLPLHPRLGRVLLAAGGDDVAAAACAILAEGWRTALPPQATTCDLWPAIDHLAAAPRGVREAARALCGIARSAEGIAGEVDVPHGADADARLRRALLAGYPDRVAQRREPRSRRLRLATGHGALLAEESGVRDADLLVALDLRSGARGPGAEARVALASRVEPAWLRVTGSAIVHAIDRKSGLVRAVERRLHGALVLSESAAPVDPARAAELLRDALLARGLGERVAGDVRRARFAGIDIDLPARLLVACAGRQGWFEFDLPGSLTHEERRRLGRLAPATLPVPSGRLVRLDYREDGTVVAAVKLQELFGLAETPRVGRDGVPVTFSLLAPNGRPVQATSDLRSFWSTTYAAVRRELRGRYPKHSWPEDPWTAPPTARTKRRE